MLRRAALRLLLLPCLCLLLGTSASVARPAVGLAPQVPVPLLDLAPQVPVPLSDVPLSDGAAAAPPAAVGIDSMEPPAIDLLKEGGPGQELDSSTIAAAVQKNAGRGKVVLVLGPGIWRIYRELEIPAQVTLRLEEGASFSLEYGSRMTLDGALQAGARRIFSGSGKVIFRQDRQDVYPQWWKHPEERHYTAAIRKALASGAGSVYFPRGEYQVEIGKAPGAGSLLLQSNTRLHGEGEESVIRLVDTPRTEGVWAAHEILFGKDLANVEISRLTFDAGKFYPDPETISRLDPSIRGTRGVRLLNVDNCRITDCSFLGFTNGSAYITGNRVTISGNLFRRASYRTQVVRLDKSRQVTVSGNSFEDIGPHYYMVLGRHDETSSVDALMVGYEVEDALIIKNRIDRVAANGIRVENSRHVRVTGNTISNVGEDGIIFYRKTTDCECSDNVIGNWGKLNNFAFVRTQKGKIYNPREYHYPLPKYPQLPELLQDAPTWEENRYHLQGRDPSTIPEYDPSDYRHILAFRGFSGIAVTEISERIKITGNRITGNRSKTGGLYNYASNYGINIGVASINPPTTSGECVVSHNTISECIDYDIYSPQYVDFHSKRNVQKPSLVFGNRCDPAKTLVFGNKAKAAPGKRR